MRFGTWVKSAQGGAISIAVNRACGACINAIKYLQMEANLDERDWEGSFYLSNFTFVIFFCQDSIWRDMNYVILHMYICILISELE